MTITETLKQYIESRYKSVREFTIAIDMPYTTLHSIFRRGIENSSVANINKICENLNISLPDLLNNKIVMVRKSVSNNSSNTFDDLIFKVSKLSTKQQQLLSEFIDTIK